MHFSIDEQDAPTPMSTPIKSNKWKPKANLEARRLALPEEDWNLASSENLPRTRRQRKIKEEESNNDSVGVSRAEATPLARELTTQDDADDLSSITEGASSSPKLGDKLNCIESSLKYVLYQKC